MKALIDLKENLNREWDDGGFFEKLRYENLIDFDKGNNLLKKLKSFALDEQENMIDRTLVRLLWYIPQFMEWQEERLKIKNDENSLKRYSQLTNEFNNELERILGVP